MGYRLTGFDYSRPYYYMVTVSRSVGFPDFARVVGERWHPGRRYEKFCAEGRMLFLSLYEATAREPTKAELYARCHEMGDLIARAGGAAASNTLAQTGGRYDG